MRPLNDIVSREDVIYSVELGARVHVCHSTENDTHPPPYIAGIAGYNSFTNGDEELIDIYLWWIHMWSGEMPNVTELQSLSLLIHNLESLGMNIDTIFTMLERWEQQEPYDERAEEEFRAYSWEEWVSNGGMDDYFPEEDL